MLHPRLAVPATLVTTTIALILALSSGGWAQAPAGRPDTSDVPPTRQDTDTRPLVTVVGASVSAGLAWRDYESWATDPDPVTFAEKQLDRPIEEKEYELRTDNIPFADAIQKVTASALRVEDHTWEQFHLAPEAMLREELSRVSDDTIVLCSFDMFFWFGYGPVPRPPDDLDESDHALHDALERLEKQRVGFELADRFLAEHPKCALVVGDYPLYPCPDPRLVLPSFVPSPLTRETLNDRLAKWAAKSTRIVVYPVAKQIERLAAEKLEVMVGDDRRMVGCEEFLQLDGLHPNRHCTAFAVCELLRFCKDRLPHDVAAKLPVAPDYGVALARVGASTEGLDYLAEIAAARK